MASELSKSRPLPPSWSTIPNKVQLALVCSIRIVDFFQQASMQAYMFYQLASFSPESPESEISFQAGVLQGIFTAAQVFTSPMWGKVADSKSYGRKGVIMISLIGQGVSCVGVAFSKSFRTAVIWRCLGGAVNASVGGARTALSESTERKYHSRTFLLLPLAWNIANIFGPIMGGLLSDPIRYYPRLVGPGSILGGTNGISWLKTYPYATPNLFSAIILLLDALLIFLFLEETLITIRNGRDRGIELAETFRYFIGRFTGRSHYTRVSQFEVTSNIEPTPVVDDSEIPENGQSITLAKLSRPKERLPTSFQQNVRYPQSASRAFLFNVFLVLASAALLDFQLGGFTGLWSIFLSTTPRSLDSDPAPILPFRFTGGLGFSPSTIGLAMSILGAAGILCQLTLYPGLNARFGLLKSTTFSLFLFPIAYIIAPYMSLLAPYSSDSLVIQLLLWVCIILVALIVISARTFAVPGSVLLINNSAPNPETLGTIHGLGAATSSAFRTLGPIVAGWWYQIGLERGRVGEAWWLLALSAIMGCVPIWWVRDS